ncbi:MAG: hypothetical protein HQM16_08445 [Deltaproteobacteria bacterium]|nr:hypothetical protein [Deltaproteobacteria bacterium]
MSCLYRALIVVFAAFAVVMALIALRDYFDGRDTAKAARILFDYKPAQNSSKRLGEIMAGPGSAPLSPLDCVPTLLSRYEGRVRFDCGAGSHGFTWLVEINSGRIIAANDRARSALSQ